MAFIANLACHVEHVNGTPSNLHISVKNPASSYGPNPFCPSRSYFLIHISNAFFLADY